MSRSLMGHNMYFNGPIDEGLDGISNIMGSESRRLRAMAVFQGILWSR